MNVHFSRLIGRSIPWFAGLVACNLAIAVPVVWTLDGVRFDDGGTASGSFLYDADVFGQTPLAKFRIETTGGSEAFGTFTYDESTAIHALQAHTIFPGGFAPYAFVHLEAPCTDGAIDCFRGLSISFATQPTNEGGQINIKPGESNAYSTESFVGTQQGHRSIVAGQIFGSMSPVPEPGTLLLFSFGLMAVAVLTRASTRTES